jgi:hypothetical protein
MLRSFALRLSVALVLSLAGGPLCAGATIGQVVATPNVIPVGVNTPVTVTVQTTDPSLIPNSVNLVRLDAAGATLLVRYKATEEAIFLSQPHLPKYLPANSN